jgi:hypothetical protein
LIQNCGQSRAYHGDALANGLDFSPFNQPVSAVLDGSCVRLASTASKFQQWSRGGPKPVSGSTESYAAYRPQRGHAALLRCTISLKQDGKILVVEIRFSLAVISK